MGKASKEIGICKPDYLIADSIHPLDTKAVEIATGSDVLKRGTLLTNAGVMATTDAETVVGILCEDVQQDSGSTTPATMYVSGSFVASEVITGDSVTAGTFENMLRQLGIYLK